MTKKEYQNLYYHIFGSSHLRKEFWTKHRDMLMSLEDAGGCAQYFITTEGQIYMKQHEEKKERMEKDLLFFPECTSVRKVDPSNPCYSLDNIPPAVSLGNCQTIAATPVLAQVCNGNVEYVYPIQEKGNNPMRIDNTTATAYVTNTKSDDAISRDYLLSRLSIQDGWRSPKLQELSDLFKLNENGLPKTYQQLIDAIKNDKFSLDERKVRRLKEIEEDVNDEDAMEDYGYGPFYAMIFTDLPKPDRKGYDEASKEFNKLLQATKDTIMVASPAEGLKALQALEAWMPTGKAN